MNVVMTMKKKVGCTEKRGITRGTRNTIKRIQLNNNYKGYLKINLRLSGKVRMFCYIQKLHTSIHPRTGTYYISAIAVVVSL